MCIAWLDPSVNRFVLLDDSVVDTAECKVSCVVDHFSTYALVNKKSFLNLTFVDDTQIEEYHSDVFIDENTNHSYMIIFWVGDWHEACSTCEKYGGNLLTINDQNEQDFIEEKVLPCTSIVRFWMGAYSKTNPYDFKWITGEEFSYTNWAPNEPSPQDEFYGEILGDIDGKYGQWNNLPDDYVYTTSCICEWDNEVGIVIEGDNPRFVEVDSLDYLPMNNKIYSKMYIDIPDPVNETRFQPIDSNGDVICGIENLHASIDLYGDYLMERLGYTKDQIIDSFVKWGVISSLSGSLYSSQLDIGILAGGLLDHFMNNTGENLLYNTNVLCEDYVFYRDINLKSILSECAQRLQEGETIILASSPFYDFTGLNVLDRYNTPGKQFTYILNNLNEFASINAAQATFVVECSLKDGIYTFSAKYYILDYYDFDSIIVPELYNLDSVGLSNNFLSIGVSEFSGIYFPSINDFIFY